MLKQTDYQQLVEWDKEYVWHPFTQMQQYITEDVLVIERGEGSYLYDIYGNKYLDGVSSIWLNVHGHNCREINEEIKAQIDLIAHSTLLGQANIPSILLARELAEILPDGLEKVFYSDDGSTAVEVAIKMAFQYWQLKGGGGKKKVKFISLNESYHGDTIGAVSVGGVALFHQIFQPLMFEGYKAPAPYCFRCPSGKNKDQCQMECLKAVAAILAEYHEEIAGLIMEPEMLAAGGMIEVPRGYLKEIRKLCSQYSVLLILDEVAVGFGRTGKMFACTHENVAPDLICLSKGITGGYLPLAATVATTEIYRQFLGKIEDQRKFTHGHSYTGNQIACAAALANLKIFSRDNVLALLQPKIAFLQNKLQKFREIKQVGDIRQRGFMIGIELVKNPATREPYPFAAQIGHRVIMEARKRGVLLRPLADVIEIVPNLAMSLAELEQILTVTYQAIQTVVKDVN